jgi:hypothetical protein
MQTPEKGSPVRWRTRRMSPTRAHSGLSFAKRRVRALEESSRAVLVAVMAARASGQVFLMFGFVGAKMGIPKCRPGVVTLASAVQAMCFVVAIEIL